MGSSAVLPAASSAWKPNILFLAVNERTSFIQSVSHMKTCRPFVLLRHCALALAMTAGPLFAQQKSTVRDEARERAANRPKPPPPDLAHVSYGPHKLNVLDLWKAKSSSPTPLLVFIHGGGFVSGSKDMVSATIIDTMREKGISVMSIDYRLSPEVVFPAHFMDCARAIQFARYNARDWNLDPKRVASMGGSAGAGTSLWIGFHDDMADPKSSDPVLRQSTRLTCVIMQGGQTTYDVRLIRAWLGDAGANQSSLRAFYGLKEGELDTARAHKLYDSASALTYLTPDDPPVFGSYSGPREITPDIEPYMAIHHVTFGLRLKERMDKLGIECVIRHRSDPNATPAQMTDFIARHLLTRK